jgi:hypothetical protein
MELQSFSEKLALNFFRLLGIISFLFAFAMILLASGATAGVVGFFMTLPGTIIMILALILGPGLSLFIWHNQHLNFMKALSLFVALLMFLFQNFDWVLFLIFIAYGIACASIGTDRFTSFLNRIGWTHE